MQVKIRDTQDGPWEDLQVVAKVIGQAGFPGDGDTGAVYVTVDRNIWRHVPPEWTSSQEFTQFIDTISSAYAKMLLSLVYGIPDKGSTPHSFSLIEFAYQQDEKNGIRLLG